MIRAAVCAAAALGIVVGDPASGAAATVEPVRAQDAPLALLSPAQLFELADAARAQGSVSIAEAAYLALEQHASVQIRTEARFRRALMLISQKHLSDAAVLLRKILDEQPEAQRVRLELARVLELLGDEAGARRALRQAQAGGLPPAVARFIDEYSEALRARRASGASMELVLAPDTNINRATRLGRLYTVIGDFELGENARERSGVGLSVRGQAFGRIGVGESLRILARASGSVDLYRSRDFDDVNLGIYVGPELSVRSGRLNLEVGLAQRWFGGMSFSRTATLSVAHLQPIDRQSIFRGTAVVGFIKSYRNSLQDGQSYAVSVGWERALAARTGIGASAGLAQHKLRDPGYSLLNAEAAFFGYREVGRTTLFANAGVSRLEADERLFIFPNRRTDSSIRATIGATLRQLSVASYAPLVRLTVERSQSTIALFSYRRVRVEAGITKAF